MKNSQTKPADRDPTDMALRTLQLERTLASVGESVVIKDLNAVVTFWNPQATALYGFTAEDAVGHPLRDLHAADLSDEAYARVLARIRSGEPSTSTTERKRKNGETIHVLIRTTPLFDAQGALIAESTITRDISDIRRAEDALNVAKTALKDKLAANRNLKIEVASRRKSELAMRDLNQAMERTVLKMEMLHRENETLLHLSELLQSCTDWDEAHAAVLETTQQLFPGISGSLFIYRESRDVLMHAVSWGDALPTSVLPEPLHPEDCWALRLGRPHSVNSPSAFHCRHMHGSKDPSICLPVHGQGEALGLLVLRVDVDEDIKSRLTALASRIGPGFANLKLRESLRSLALRDTLTGLYNRRYMEDALKRLFISSRHNDKPFSILMVDIDHFKRFNDTFGHAAGDAVLAAIAKCIKSTVRTTDFACRYGGEELVVLMPDTSMDNAMARAEAIRVAIRESNITHDGQTLPACTASFGVAVSPAHGDNTPDLFKAADAALYRAKAEGRDRVCAAANVA
jgi:diguanylate cyclase (GGDEF)-like protein/PAS domain S-box-containing protein